MKLRHVSLCIFVAAALMGCNRSSTASPPVANDRTQVDAPSQKPPMTARDSSQGDALALGLLAAVNGNEIAMAEQAEKKGVAGPVREYAQMMRTEHSENLAQTRELGELASSGPVQEEKDKGMKELATLEGRSGKDYEKSYVDAMVMGHQAALDLIDGKMLPAATSAPVKAHLQETRKHVSMHLASAKALKVTK